MGREGGDRGLMARRMIGHSGAKENERATGD